MLDSLADCFSRIRNAGSRSYPFVEVVKSKKVLSVLNVLKAEGFIGSVVDKGDVFSVGLKYFQNGQPLISKLAMVSKPSRRVYAKKSEIRPVRGGLGCFVLSTSRGVISSRELAEKQVGGEVLAIVY